MKLAIQDYLKGIKYYLKEFFEGKSRSLERIPSLQTKQSICRRSDTCIKKMKWVKILSIDIMN